MFLSHDRNKNSSNYTLPSTKLRNVFCVHCKHQFFLRDFVPLCGLVPLLLDCGHVICDKCVKIYLNKPCPVCNIVTSCQNNQKPELSTNIYMLGLMVVSHNRPINTDDSNISFTQPINAKLKQQSTQGFCHECGIQASVKCLQCVVLYCNICYSKIHGRALQNHTKVILSENNSENSIIVSNACSQTCSEPLGYYCKSCNVAGCSHCMLLLHKAHNYLSLLKKNTKVLPEFYKVTNQLVENLQRVHQVQRKLKSIDISSTNDQSSDAVEATVTQHFAYLHGVLQNLEKKLMTTLDEYRNSKSKNVDELSQQVKKLENELQSTLRATSTVAENIDTVDLQQLMAKLQKFVDIPCHLLLNPVAEDQEIKFYVDRTIVDALEKHCSVQVPSVSSFSLQRKDLLPDDYEVEPLAEEQKVPTKDTSKETLALQKNENYPTAGYSEMVRVTHVEDPSCFYVQLVQSHNKIAELSKGLAGLASISATVPSEVTLNTLFLVQSSSDWGWHRGRIIDTKKTDANADVMCSIFFIDYGTKEENVPLSRIRTILPQFAVLPVMALKCTLHDVVPNDGTWHPDAIQVFKRLVFTNAMVSMSIMMVTGDTYFVDLCAVSSKDSGLISIKDSLTYMKYATCVSPNKLMRLNPDSTQRYYKEQLEIESYADVQILFVESPDCIYVQKTRSNRTHLYKLVQEMTDEYERNPLAGDFLHTPYKDLPCAAKGVDGYWHRGLIQEVTENTVKVFYVDLGYTLILSYNAIKTLPKKYMSCKTQAIKISLRNIKPISERADQWQPEATEYLKKLILDNKQFRIIAFEKFDDRYSVVMYTQQKSNVSYLLTKNGLALNTSINHFVSANAYPKRKGKQKNFDKAVTVVKEKSVIDTHQDVPSKINSVKNKSLIEDNEDPFKISVIVHRVESPDCIYLSETTYDQSNLEQMMTQMKKFYSKYRSAQQTFVKDAVCAVYISKHDAYYRGRIIDIIAAEKVVVHLYDLGIEETVAVSNIQSLYPLFSTAPAFVFRVKLTGILPCGGTSAWPLLSCEELREIIDSNQNSKFYISKLEQEDADESAIPVELWIKQAKMDGPLAPTRIEINSINRILVEKGVALPIKKYTEKRDKILAIELKRQLMKKLERLSKCEANVKWFKIKEDPDNYINLPINSELPKTLQEQSSNSDTESEDFSVEEESDDILLTQLSAWLPADPIPEYSFIAIPTYLDYDGFLYLHSKARSKETLEYIEKKLEKMYKDTAIQVYDTVWKVGDICIAQYHANNKWYRGKVVGILENDIISVEFVDYGNIEECSIEALRKEVALKNIPIQCTKCSIDGLISGHKNGKLAIEDLDKIHSLLIEKECRVTILSRNNSHLVISVTLLPSNTRKKKTDLIRFLVNELEMDIKPNLRNSESEGSFNTTDTTDVIIENFKSFCSNQKVEEDLIISGHSVLVQNADVNKNESCTTTDLENLSWCKVKNEVFTSTPYVTSEENLVMDYKMVDIPEDIEYIEIELCCSISATEFYAQLKENEHSTVLNAYYAQYELLMSKLQRNANKQPLVTNLDPKTPCCAKFNDGLWYRCLIVESKPIQGTNNVEVKLFYVDYGNDEYRTIHSEQHELYMLKKEWMDLPISVIKCKLWNVKVAAAADYKSLLFQLEKLYNKRVIATIKEAYEEFMSVELFEDTKCETLMYRNLIEEGLFEIETEKE